MFASVEIAIFEITMQIPFSMVLLRTKLLLSSVTFVPLSPHVLNSTHFRFFHCTHNQLTAILWKHTLYGTKFHLTFYRLQIIMLFVVLCYFF